MGVYFGRDIDVETDGDLILSDNGDLKVARSIDSVFNLVKRVLATDLGEIATQRQFGANLGSLIGSTETERVLSRIPIMVADGVRSTQLLEAGDIRTDVVLLDPRHILMYVDINGVFLDSTGRPIQFEKQSLKFLFPYTEAALEEI